MNNFNNYNNTGGVKKDFFSAWVKDLTVAYIQNAPCKPTTTDEVFNIYKDFFNKMDGFLNGSK